MLKVDFINKVVCEHWFDLVSWKGKKWDDNRKSFWLSGMIAAWNMLNPHESIEEKEVMIKTATWSKEQAQQWYLDYMSQVEEDDGEIESRWQILDL